MKSEFIIALTQLAAERNLPREVVLSAIEDALAFAYKRDSVSEGQNISVKLDPESGDINVRIVKTVVEEVEDPEMEVPLKEAIKQNKDIELGDMIPTEELIHTTGRIAAQTAKQVVIQRLKEAERELVFKEYADKEGQVFTVTVQKLESTHVTVELGRAEALLPISEQPPYERYRVGQKMKVLLQAVRRSSKGPELIVSRADKLLVRRLFEMEVPEIYNESVEIVAISREAGSRSKVAVFAKQDGVDAVGSCVGLRGIRIQNIVNELYGEKIDVVKWSKDISQFVAGALSPSLVMRVDVNEQDGSVVAVVPERQLSLAIGKDGQNARLAAKLTGLKVDIKSNVEADAEVTEVAAPAAEKAAAPVAEAEVESPVAEADARLTDVEVPAAEAEVDTVEVEESPEPELAEVVSVPVDAEKKVDGKPQKGASVEEPEVPSVGVEEVEVEPLVAEVTDDLFLPEEIKEESKPMPPVEVGAPIRELGDDVWTIRRPSSAEPGVIRFAEDIEELNRDRDSRRRVGGGSNKARNSRKTNTRSGRRR